MTDAQERTVETRYDELDRLTHRIEQGTGGVPPLVTQILEYDPEGAVLRYRDPEQQEFRFEVDVLGRPTDAYAPTGTTESILRIHVEYDEDGNPDLEQVTRAQPGGGTTLEVTDPEWDDFGRLDHVVERGLRIDYDYDADHHQTLVSTPTAATVYDYDERGRLARADIGVEQTHFRYESDGRLRSVERPNGTTSAYDYDPRGRLQRLTHADATTAVLAQLEYAYDGDGNRTWELSRVDGAAESTFYGFTPIGQLEEVARFEGVHQRDARPADTTGHITRYAYEGFERTQESVQLDGQLATRAYDYDAFGRLEHVRESGGRTLSYTYDANGNTLTRTDSADPAASGRGPTRRPGSTPTSG